MVHSDLPEGAQVLLEGGFVHAEDHLDVHLDEAISFKMMLSSCFVRERKADEAVPGRERRWSVRAELGGTKTVLSVLFIRLVGFGQRVEFSLWEEC